MGENQEIKQIWAGSKNFNFCICVILAALIKALFFLKGGWALGYVSSWVWDFAIIS